MFARKHDPASNKMTSTGFDYFGVCDVVFPSLPTALTTPAPPDTHIIGTYRIYKEQTSVMLGKEYISIYRSDKKTGYVDGTRKKTKVWFYPNSTQRNSYSNKGDTFIIKLMPVGHIGK